MCVRFRPFTAQCKSGEVTYSRQLASSKQPENRRQIKSVRVRSDAFSTRYKISSNRSNAGLCMVLQGRSEAGCQSVAVRVTPLTRRCRANTGVRRMRRTPPQEVTAGPQAKQEAKRDGVNGPARRRIVCRRGAGRTRGCRCIRGACTSGARRYGAGGRAAGKGFKARKPDRYDAVGNLGYPQRIRR
jgi:hypothetical protein